MARVAASLVARVERRFHVARREGGGVLFPTHDEAVAALGPHRRRGGCVPLFSKKGAMTAATVPGLDATPTENDRLLTWVREVAVKDVSRYTNEFIEEANKFDVDAIRNLAAKS